METNEAVKIALWREAERELVKLVERIKDVGEGDLKELEQQVMEAIFAIGRGLMEGILNQGEQAEGAATRREGSCGHQQRLVGERPKELLTLLGKVKFRRLYYQCLLGESSPHPQREKGQAKKRLVRMGKRPPMRCGAFRSDARPLGCKRR